MTTRVRKWIFALAVVGLAAAGSSTYMHYQLASNPAYTSFCDINETVSCTSLYQSRYGSVMGIPVALGGVLWFGVVLLLLMADARGPVEARENVSAYFLVWSTIGLSVAMYMAFASFWILGTFCLLCGIVYVSVIGIFLLTGSETSTSLTRLPSAIIHDLRRLVRRPVGLLVSVLVIGGVAGAAVLFPEPTPLAALAASPASSPAPRSVEEERSEFARYWEDLPRVTLDLEAEPAPVVVYKFNDYQCPACAQTHLAYEAVFAKYESSDPGSVRLVMVDFPLDPTCNDQAPNGQHRSACAAAVGARLAFEVGEEEGHRMQRWLYANQQTMTAEAIAKALSDITGLGEDHLSSRYDQMIERVRADIAVGATLPVEATPTFVVNGVLLKGGLSPEFFDQAIAIELERARGS